MAETIYDIPLKTIEGEDAKLGDYAGKVLLVVNVASKCGLTPQYEALQALYAAKKDQGLVIAGFPANDFGAQEPGTEAEIVEFCSTIYGVDFPMFEKITVVGEDKHPLYKALTLARPEAKRGEDMRERFRSRGREPNPPPEVMWNFEKFIVGRDGKVVDRFAPSVTPDDAELVAQLDRALAAG